MPSKDRLSESRCWPRWARAPTKNIEEACSATIKVVSDTPLDKKAAKVYEQGFPIYQQLYRSLKGDFKSIAKMAT